MNAKDKKIIAANTGKTPYELMQLGLSPDGFAELDKQNTSIIEKQINIIQSDKLTPSKPTVTPTNKHIAVPVLSRLEDTNTSGLVMVRNKNTGMKTPMNATTAIKFVKKYSSKYEIS